MAVSCGQGGLSLGEFWDATPREIQYYLKGVTEIRKAESQERWMIGRSIAINALGAMVGFDKLKYNKVPFFPEIESEPTKARELTDDQRKLIEKMDALINNPDTEWELYG